ncbi:unnamed protein product [Dovyalis caffra]|uniref:Methyltransferase domain-containing protein n=1 Tax=Dovyalis caffra TaxID=77055 RepID=A0AAV1RFR3_9ROSI|nr:unnamed protein product [Dovyalis caffra]
MAAASTDGADTREVNQGIAQFYDQSTGVWEDIWGDHIHYGFCDPVSGTESDYRAAQIRMIEEALSFAGVSEDPGKRPKNALDVGCGIGGTTKYIARKYGAKCIGINLSPIQIQRANALAAAEGLADKVSFQVADALEQPFSDGQFDLVLSVECGEYIPDKRKVLLLPCTYTYCSFLRLNCPFLVILGYISEVGLPVCSNWQFAAELARVTAPGGKIVILSFCHRDLGPSEESLQPWELKRLKKIYDAFQIQGYCSAADYVNFFESLSLQDIKTADWTQYIAPFLPLLFRSALTWKGLSSLLPSLLRGGKLSLHC